MSSNSIKDSLSAARIGTYENIVGGTASLLQTEKALRLYMWNAQISAAFFVPLHVCEVLTRNAISEVIEKVYGDRWPWSIGFERSLPIPIHGYKPKDDLISGRRNQPTTGKVIPELKFVFWQKMLTGRFDTRLWNNHILTAFPHAVAQGLSAAQLRQNLYNDLETVRKLRNRIAHHEPIINRNLLDDFATIKRIIAYRCEHSVEWMQNNQMLLPLLTLKP
ncbi:MULTISPECIES: hypothetical protein [Pectobacterium]|uniref:hypothetical protein n=1 Tax=Pectobacterium TaxID=122277 RepID=UPI00057CE201|nr:hypothetical protein [Pectobacterium brasiliense]KHS63879.1 hypothetical protein QT13_19700 [Pectobacterium brasiliense]KHS73680.1 hypothetical protein RC79_11695 [Pectobacterium brasiliense]KHS88239.1 hypothetical protein RC83_09255 [Pectobacterium brasiliense]KHT02299.1 hypothetical protein RC92_20230 [Pectobacterium brasiliense]UDQ76002.1 hypothetical protein LJQ72_21305 [Pectobacterium brasiliense]